MTQTYTYDGLKVTNSNHAITHDNLVIESPLQININNESYTVVMRTPGDDEQLVRGLLYAEDIYKKHNSLNFRIIKEQDQIPTVINVQIKSEDLGNGYLNKRTLLSVSSCGICGKQKLEDLYTDDKKLEEKLSFSSKNLFVMFQQLKEKQYTFQKSGGSHAAGVFDKAYNLLTVREDIGRHNAVDKCVGDLLQKQLLKKANYLLVSGRVSYEIVSKAFLAKIPVIVAVSACSSMAVDFAKEFGICLIGFTRDQKMTIYSNPSFLKQ